MIAYDEGMMDEGAASLCDRDMIARRRGGPFVHRYSVSVFSLSISRTCSSLLLLPLSRPTFFRLFLLSYSSYTSRIHRARNAAERTPVTGLSDLVVVFGERDCKKDSRTISHTDILSRDLRSNVLWTLSTSIRAISSVGTILQPFIEPRPNAKYFCEMDCLKIQLHVLAFRSSLLLLSPILRLGSQIQNEKRS